MAGRTSLRSVLGLLALVLGVSLASQWWSQQQAGEVGQQLAALAAPGDIVMLSSDICAPCLAARRWMQQHKVAFAECSIERDADCAERFRAAGAPGTPLLFVRGQPQLGFVPERLRAALQRPA